MADEQHERGPEETHRAHGAPLRDPDTETDGHYRRRMSEVEPDLGRSGRWGYLFWVGLWVVVLVVVVLIYVIAGRSI